MDKKTELALQKRRSAPAPETVNVAAPAAVAATPAPQPPAGWWMYHGDPEHTGYVSDSSLNSTNVATSSFKMLFTLQLGGPVLSVPAVADGFIYVGLANFHKATGGNG